MLFQQQLSKYDTQRVALARQLLTSATGKAGKTKHASMIVYRHLQHGDLVLMNRQPTLHR